MLPTYRHSEHSLTETHVHTSVHTPAGMVVRRIVGSEYHTSTDSLALGRYILVAREFGSWELVQTLLKCLRRAADRLGGGTTVAQVAIAWVLQLPAVSSCIVGLPR